MPVNVVQKQFPEVAHFTAFGREYWTPDHWTSGRAVSQMRKTSILAKIEV
jgi:hypothetical protein